MRRKQQNLTFSHRGKRYRLHLMAGYKYWLWDDDNDQLLASGKTNIDDKEDAIAWIDSQIAAEKLRSWNKSIGGES